MVRKIYLRIAYYFLSNYKFAKLSGVVMGKNCKIGTKKLGSEPYLITIGDDFYTSSNIQFITHDGSVNVLRNSYSEHKTADLFGRIKIGNNVFIGYGCTILPGSIIADNVIVGANTVVKGSLKSNSVYAGVPARYICSLDEYKQKIQSKLVPTKGMSAEDKMNYIKKNII